MAKQQPHVPKSERDCHIHGKTTHSCYMAGSKESPIPQWKCLKCEVVRVVQRVKDRKAGIAPKRGPNAPVKPDNTKYCSIHNLALPATGECDYC